jgi:hypothetical protein
MPRVRAIFLLFVLCAPPLLDLYPGDFCATACEDDADGQDCPPLCGTCACAARVMPSLPVASATVTPPPPAETSCAGTLTTWPQEPEPREILHVPISLA